MFTLHWATNLRESSQTGRLAALSIVLIQGNASEAAVLTWMKTYASTKSRAWRAQLFKNVLNPPDDASILDLGGGKGTHMARFYPAAKNVHIADFNPDALDYARVNYGFTPYLVDGGDGLPFSDGQFDVVFCSSVIEHVTGEKHAAARTFKKDGRKFKTEAYEFQKRFASEIRRVGKRYFVQTPARSFPVETHSWIPLIGMFPTHWQWQVMRLVNWLPYPRKQTMPDWSLLSFDEFRSLFPDAQIYRERVLGLTKSFIAVGGPAEEGPSSPDAAKPGKMPIQATA